MNDDESKALFGIHRELAALDQRVKALAEHKAGASDMSRIEQEFRNADFRTLQEISGQISNLRTDLREWTGNAVDAAETRIMAAIKSDRGWQKQLPVYIMIALAAIAILTGNPHMLRLIGGVS